MRVRMTEFEGTPEELTAVPGLVRAVRFAIRRNVRAPGVPGMGPLGGGLGSVPRDFDGWSLPFGHRRRTVTRR